MTLEILIIYNKKENLLYTLVVDFWSLVLEFYGNILNQLKKFHKKLLNFMKY